MKGLRKYIAPFAPDQSGAAAVLYELGGILVICDAGGCTGNICGFDEPRWFQKKSAIFSAGLRDMDAILGRDEHLIRKLKGTADKMNAEFAAIIGTPVPAVIGTDYRALKRMAEKKTALPILTIETTGMKLYDEGQETAYFQIFKKFACETTIKQEQIIGIIGATPLDMPFYQDENPFLNNSGTIEGKKIWCYGMGSGIDKIKRAGEVGKNIVVSPSGLKTAQYLEKKFGTPYKVQYPFLPSELLTDMNQYDGKRILIIHQQVMADTIRKEIQKNTKNALVYTSTWFMQKKELMESGDIRFTEEDEFTKYVMHHDYDIIIGDPIFKRAIPEWKGKYISLGHFAVSGRM